jgi:hypothetical protein
MDNSKLRVKMCDCPEIQNEWHPELGDFCVCKGAPGLGLLVVVALEGFPKSKQSDRLVLRGTPDRDENFIRGREELIWLPRLDQLEGILATQWAKE